MPIPGSILNTLFDPRSARLVYQSLATFLVLTKGVDSTGQETHTFVPSVDPALSALPCRKAPLRTDRVQEQEASVGMGIQREQANYRLSLMATVPVAQELLIQWQVSVDGTVYQIQSVEPDGSGLTTRLMIADWVPFNA